MKIYMISLKRDIERREQMQKKFPRYYPKFHIIDAVDAREESSAKFIQKYDKPCPNDKRRPLTKGEKCCAISHLLALEDFLQSGDERCIIVEDDIIGHDNDFDKSIQMTGNLNVNGLFIFGGQQGLKNSKYLVARKNIKGFWIVPKISITFITRACCYSFDRETAQIIYRAQINCLTRSDNWQKYKGKFKFYFSDILAHPDDLTKSNLETERSTRGIIFEILADGLKNLMQRNFKKIIIFSLVSFKLFKKINKST